MPLPPFKTHPKNLQLNSLRRPCYFLLGAQPRNELYQRSRANHAKLPARTKSFVSLKHIMGTKGRARRMSEVAQNEPIPIFRTLFVRAGSVIGPLRVGLPVGGKHPSRVGSDQHGTAAPRLQLMSILV